MSEIKRIVSGTTNIFTSVVGIPGNIFSLIYFIRKKKKVSNFLYRCICCCDLISCLLILPKIQTSFSSEQPRLFGNSYFCEIWNFLWKTSYKFSLFAVLMLAVVRSYCLIFPFRPIRSSIIKIATLVYLLLLVLQEILLKVFLKFVSHYDRKYGHCVWLLHLPNRDDMTTMISPFSNKFKLLIFLYIDLQVTVPMVIVVVSCLVTLSHMLMTSRGKDNNTRNRATGTILVVTICCFIFNFPHTIVRTLDTVSIFTEFKFKWYTGLSPATISFIYSFLDAPLLALNAAINPLIYMWRMREYRVWLGMGKKKLGGWRRKRTACKERYSKIEKTRISTKLKSSKV